MVQSERACCFPTKIIASQNVFSCHIVIFHKKIAMLWHYLMSFWSGPTGNFHKDSLEREWSHLWLCKDILWNTLWPVCGKSWLLTQESHWFLEGNWQWIALASRNIYVYVDTRWLGKNPYWAINHIAHYWVLCAVSILTSPKIPTIKRHSPDEVLH